jgi:hypothetical protein
LPEQTEKTLHPNTSQTPLNTGFLKICGKVVANFGKMWEKVENSVFI